MLASNAVERDDVASDEAATHAPQHEQQNLEHVTTLGGELSRNSWRHLLRLGRPNTDTSTITGGIYDDFTSCTWGPLKPAQPVTHGFTQANRSVQQVQQDEVHS